MLSFSSNWWLCRFFLSFKKINKSTRNIRTIDKNNHIDRLQSDKAYFLYFASQKSTSFWYRIQNQIWEQAKKKKKIKITYSNKFTVLKEKTVAKKINRLDSFLSFFF